MSTLKQEVNQLSAEILGLAKWKLGVVAATAIVGLGWGDVRPDSDTGVLLLCLVGFLCAYIDWLCYRRFASIHVIARYFREYKGSDPEIMRIKDYEDAMQDARSKRLYFPSERWAMFLSTLAFAIGLPVIGMLQYAIWQPWQIALAVIGILLNVGLFLIYNSIRHRSRA